MTRVIILYCLAGVVIWGYAIAGIYYMHFGGYQ